jgi:hypothetical protein
LNISGGEDLARALSRTLGRLGIYSYQAGTQKAGESLRSSVKTKTLPLSKRGRQEGSKSREDEDCTENRGDDPADQQRDGERSEGDYRYQDTEQREFES